MKGGAKIRSIGGQCGLAGLGVEHFELLGRQFGTLIDKLSEAKQATLGRDELNGRFDLALQFLIALTGSVDVGKLRKV